MRRRKLGDQPIAPDFMRGVLLLPWVWLLHPEHLFGRPTRLQYLLSVKALLPKTTTIL
jgi:hypothetical protein